MRILVTAAEEEELLTAQMAYNSLPAELKEKIKITWMLTGIGSTSTTYRLTKMLHTAEEPFDMAINAGIAGSFSGTFPLGSVARIGEEYFGDLGFETFSGFQTLFDYRILDADTFPYKNGALHAPLLAPEIEEALSGLRKARAVTVQTVSGLPERTEVLKRGFSPEIESMEGAAFFYVCLLEEIPFLEIRSVSNEVGERDRSKWNIPLALDALKKTFRNLFLSLAN